MNPKMNKRTRQKIAEYLQGMLDEHIPDAIISPSNVGRSGFTIEFEMECSYELPNLLAFLEDIQVPPSSVAIGATAILDITDHYESYAEGVPTIFVKVDTERFIASEKD